MRCSKLGEGVHSFVYLIYSSPFSLRLEDYRVQKEKEKCNHTVQDFR